MNDFWNDRYSNTDYAYGIQPNDFFKKTITKFKPGKLLLPAEGEGRNAVFASKLGWDVTAFDLSINAKKAEALAILKKVSINYIIAGFNNFKPNPQYFDCIALIFAHLSNKERRLSHQKLLKSLKPGGIVILEGFSKNQINNKSGGPNNLEMLFSKEELVEDFAILEELEVDEEELELNEGIFHNGKSSLIRLIGAK